MLVTHVHHAEGAERAEKYRKRILCALRGLCVM
jgi:hypothetical protein